MAHVASPSSAHHLEPLLPRLDALQHPSKRGQSLRAKLLHKLGGLALIVAVALALAFSLPTNKNLPCPWCQVSSVIGWLYFCCWSSSFWPQLIVNWRRKSVEGLSFDFTVLNVLGFACYTQFNLALFLSPAVRAEYSKRFDTADIPVELNDVVFGVHALLASCALAVQCLLYPRAAHQRVARSTWLGLSGALAAAGGLAGYLAVTGEARPPLTWLDLCYFCSFIKMGVTLIKYVPQVHLNALNQSTEGWSIDNVLLDLSGGLLSVGQLLVSCDVLQDWTAVTGNPIKFGLGLVSIGFDAVFMLQHYVWYRAPSSISLQQQLLKQGQEEAALVVSVDVASISSDEDAQERH